MKQKWLWKGKFINLTLKWIWANKARKWGVLAKNKKLILNSLEKQSSHQKNWNWKLTKEGLEKQKDKNLLVLTSLAQKVQMLYEGTHFQSLYQGRPQICGNGLEYEKNTQTKTWPSDSLSSWVSFFYFIS